MLCLLLIVACLGPLPALVRSLVANQCQEGFNYVIEINNGGYYVLVGLPSSLKSQYTNHTAQISVEGTYYPGYLNQDPNYRGLVYVSQYVINESTYTFAQTIIMVSGTLTSTSTNTRQIMPTTITGVTGTVTLSSITLTGLLDYAEGFCVTPLLTTTSVSSTEGSSSPTISGFPSLAIILGLSIGLSVVLINRKKMRGVKT